MKNTEVGIYPQVSESMGYTRWAQGGEVYQRNQNQHIISAKELPQMRSRIDAKPNEAQQNGV